MKRRRVKSQVRLRQAGRKPRSKASKKQLPWTSKLVRRLRGNALEILGKEEGS